MTPVLKIDLIAPEFPPQTGGVQTYAWQLAQALSRHGNQLAVYTLRNLPLPEPHASRPFIIRPVLTGNWHQDRRILVQSRPDIRHALNAAYAPISDLPGASVLSVHGNDFLHPYILTGALNIKKALRLPRGDSWNYRLDTHLTRLLIEKGLRRIGAVVANSSYTRRALRERYPSCAPASQVIHPGVADLFLHSRHSVPPSTGNLHRLITVARLEDPRKNVELALHALSALRTGHDFTYTVVGEGPLRPGLEALSGRLGLSDRVRFTGRVEDNLLPSLLADADLFLLPSSASSHSFEGFGIAYLEANACGLPVLAAREGGAPEAVIEGKTGVLVDELNPSTLAGTLSSLWKNPGNFDPAVCRSHAAGFDWRSRASAFMDLYYNLTEPTGAPHKHGFSPAP